MSGQAANKPGGPTETKAPGRRAPSEELLGQALDRTLLKRIFGYVWPYKKELIVAVALLPVISLFEIAQPYLLKKAIDEHIAIGRLAGLDRVGLAYLGVLVGQYAAGFAQIYLTQLIGQRGMNALRMRVHEHVLSLSASFFDRTPVGRLMTRMTSDIEALNEMFASGLVSLLGDLIRLVLHPGGDLRHRLEAGAVLDGDGAGAVRHRGLLPAAGCATPSARSAPSWPG